VPIFSVWTGAFLFALAPPGCIKVHGSMRMKQFWNTEQQQWAAAWCPLTSKLQGGLPGVPRTAAAQLLPGMLYSYNQHSAAICMPLLC
jgi:hypothetical protein